jgi:hypothetical protein
MSTNTRADTREYKTSLRVIVIRMPATSMAV